jgi:hypothetical protein
MRYKYRKYRSRQDPGVILLEPVIPVRLKYGARAITVLALIDSGADSCFFHASIGKALGIDIKSGREEKVRSLSPQPIPIYMHTVQLILKGEPAINIDVGFIESDLLADGGLLGQEGFFDEFDIRFQRWLDTIDITRKKGWKTR